jgi:hypothetical protein
MPSCTIRISQLLLCIIYAALTFTTSIIEVATADMGVGHIAIPLTPNALVDAQSDAPHYDWRRLDLRCDGSVGPCSWLVTSQMMIGSGTAKFYDLWLRDLAGASTNLFVSQTTLTGSPFSTAVEIMENGPTGFISRIQADSPSQIPGGVNPVEMHSFILSQNVAQTSGTQNVIAASYYGFQGTGPFTDPGYSTRFAFIDDNPIRRHVFLYEEWPNPVIRITNTPEPATAALLLAPAVLLMRRRRQTGRR